MNEERNLIAFVMQLVVIVCSVLYIIYIFKVEKYFDTTPPILGIVSLAIAMLYFCVIGYSKFNIKNLDKHHLYSKDKTVYKFKLGYLVISIVILIVTAVAIFKVDELSVEWSDTLGIITLMITLSVELLTNFIFFIAKLYILNYTEEE